ncbi:MAG: RimK family protein [Gammaproteobacteria bacterium]|nr:RimK family protein [Gammaproteobacteria bacterium]
MSQVIIVVERPQDWKSYYPSDQLQTVAEFLHQGEGGERNIRVINLCRGYKYLSNGYYCSLLSEARGFRAIPSVRTINDLSRRAIYALEVASINQSLQRWFRDHPKDGAEQLTVPIFFGTTPVSTLQNLARQLFEQFPCPILEALFVREAGGWKLQTLRPGEIQKIATEDEEFFANALDQFSRNVWRQPRTKKRMRYELAILHDPNEDQPPSDKVALKKFIRVGKQAGVEVELIEKRDLMRLGEFDALLIRETTAIDNHTYRFAKRAESEGLVVIDDPTSILRCTNKIYLNDLLRNNRLPIPRSEIIDRSNRKGLLAIGESLGFPCVLKIPDGSFSRGVYKVADNEELSSTADRLFRKSALLLVQEFMPTEFDWRIGIFNRKPLFACQYFMTRGHWQIYHYQSSGKVTSGGFKTLPVHDAPAKVVKAAIAATNLIGDGLYGVDLKQHGDTVSIIEINDNPNIDSGVEDLHLGDELYRIIIDEFVRRLERKRMGW